MTGLCIEKIEHRTATCDSSDGLQVFQADDGSYNGHCFACNTHIPDPYSSGRKPPTANRSRKSPEEIQAQLDFISSLRSMPLPDRHLRKETLEYFGIKVGTSEEDGETPVFHYYPYESKGNVVGYMVRYVPEKKFWRIGQSKDVDLCGWQQALASGSKTLFITEGQLDMGSLFQALKDKQRGTKWEHLNPAVVSLTSGAGSAKLDITRQLQDIRASFKEVVLVFDMDDPGRKATQDVMQLLPHARAVHLPAKDANECLQRGYALALCNAVLFRAATPKNTRIIRGGELHVEGRKQAEWGLSWPWEGVTRLTRGMRYGETYYLGAGVKMGKSEMVNSLIAWLITEHGLNVFAAKPEETNKKTYQLVCGKVAGKVFHDPNVEFDYDAYDAASAVVGDNLYLLNLYQHVGWDSLRADIMEAVETFKCKAVFIDPITNLTNGIAAGEANTVLQGFAQDLAAVAKDLEILVFIFCHLLAPDSGAPHERGGKIYSNQFAGSRAMMRSCNYMFGLEGNKDPDMDEELRNMRRLVLLEDREFGASGTIPLYWDRKTSLFNEVEK